MTPISDPLAAIFTKPRGSPAARQVERNRAPGGRVLTFVRGNRRVWSRMPTHGLSMSAWSQPVSAP